MTREEAVVVLKAFMENPLFSDVHKQAFNIAIHDIKQRHDWDINKLMLVPKTEWEQEPSGDDAVSRDAVKEQMIMYGFHASDMTVTEFVEDLPSVSPQEPRCKDCKWWKDSDGEYRRGCGAESQCPINRREVFEGNGYCYMFEPQEGRNKWIKSGK